jgi:hypothetical protein
MAPPNEAVFPLKVQLFKVGKEVELLYIPPPLPPLVDVVLSLTAHIFSVKWLKVA